jgi:xanthine dehydrogenase large subunit
VQVARTVYLLQVSLSATAWWDGSDTSGPHQGMRQLSYTSFGAAVSEVEIDVLTGEKLVLRSDILFDCGHSTNPGIDIGQVKKMP